MADFSISQTIAAFKSTLDKAVDITMRYEGQAKAVEAMQGAIEINVYDAYPDSQYPRKMQHGGLTDPQNIETAWEKQIMTLSVESTRTDWEPTRADHEGRLVAPVVESGSGYDYHPVGPRNFTRLTGMILEEEVEKALQVNMDMTFNYWNY